MGAVTEAQIKQYIENQSDEAGSFKVWDKPEKIESDGFQSVSFPIGKRYSVDPLTDWFHERIAWAYYDTVFEVTSVNAPGEDFPFDDGMLFVGVNVFPEEKCHDLRNNVVRHDPCHPYVFSESDVLTLLRLCNVHPVFKKLHDPTNPEEPDERYFAVFGLVCAPETPLPPPPGVGWEPIGTGPRKGLQGRKGEANT